MMITIDGPTDRRSAARVAPPVASDRATSRTASSLQLTVPACGQAGEE
jgi:hypothetical protein